MFLFAISLTVCKKKTVKENVKQLTKNSTLVAVGGAVIHLNSSNVSVQNIFYYYFL